MRPISDSIPKPLIKINHKPIIQYSIDKLNQIPSLTKIIINGHYLAAQIEDFIKNQQNPRIVFSFEPNKIETGGALVFARQKIDLDKPLLIINGDILWLEDYNQKISDIELLYQKWQKLSQNNKNCDILLGLKPIKHFFGYEGNGDFDLINNQLFYKKDQLMSHAYIGISIINPQIINRAPQENCFSLSYFFREKIDISNKIENVYGQELNGNYFHISKPSSISKTSAAISQILNKN